MKRNNSGSLEIVTAHPGAAGSDREFGLEGELGLAQLEPCAPHVAAGVERQQAENTPMVMGLARKVIWSVSQHHLLELAQIRVAWRFSILRRSRVVNSVATRSMSIRGASSWTHTAL